ncbi:MAG: hypothetical protein EOP18_01400 [Rhizobiaceae bacterium]|nr:MAG: hypothetical protein EOP18_01400 [Rhizobiaceae bacterium]
MKNGTEILIVDGPLSSEKPRKPKYRTARSEGSVVRVRVVDADSPTFGADFEAAFRANVRRARQDNRAIKAK